MIHFNAIGLRTANPSARSDTNTGLNVVRTLDAGGNDFEFMQYLTPDIEARNLYDV